MPRWAKESTRLFIRNRWMVLIAGIWIECCAGASYGFGIYSEDLKANFGYRQQDLETISFFKDMGECVGIISGFMYERFPPWAVLLTGALQNHAGYLMIWLSLTARVPKPALWQMCLYIFLAINSQTYLTTASMVTSVRNFPANKGIVVGLMKGCIGLSDAILTRIWRAMPLGQEAPHGGSSFLLVASLVPTIVAVLFMPMVSTVPEEDRSREKSVSPKFALVSVPIVFLAILLMVSALAVGVEPATNRILGFVVILILMSPWGVLLWKTEPELGTNNLFIEEPLMPSAEERGPWATSAADDMGCHTDQWRAVGKGKSLAGEDRPSSDIVLLQDPEQNGFIRCHGTGIGVGDGGPLCKIAARPEFVLLLCSSAMALGTGFAAINNVGQVASSQNYADHAIRTFISLISIWQFLGRFGAGALSDYVLRRWAIPRPLLIAVASALLSFSYMLIATSLAGTLYMGSILIGFCFGSVYSLVPTVTSDLFGLEHFASLYNIVLMGNPVVSYILSVWVAGYLYDRETQIEGHNPFNVWRKARDCKGRGCFELSFCIMGGVGLLASCGFVILWRKTRKFYECGHV